jgi:hypothetical protein
MKGVPGSQTITRLHSTLYNDIKDDLAMIHTYNECDEYGVCTKFDSQSRYSLMLFIHGNDT